MLEIVALLALLSKPKRGTKKAGKRIPSAVLAEIEELEQRLLELQRRIAK
jgi:hypothetical protein